MKIEESNIRRWSEEFDYIRKFIKASPSYWEWYEPTQQILDILPPVVDDYYLCTFIFKGYNRGKPIMITGYYRLPRWSDSLIHKNKTICCGLIDSERMESLFLQLAKELKGAFLLRASKKLAQAFLDNVYTSESDKPSSPSGTKKD